MNSRRHALAAWFCLMLGACLIPVAADAQENVRDTITGKVHQIGEVTVKARRMSSNVTSSAPVQQISRDALKQQGITDIADALRRFSGANIKDYGGAGGMKTVSVRSLGSQHTAVIYDGITISDTQSGQVDLSRFSLDNLQEMSLTIGDNDDIFQPARTVASAASVRLQSAEPQLENKPFALKAEMKVGSYGMVNPFVRYDQRITKKLSTSLSGDFMRADNNYPFTLVNGKLKTKERRDNNQIETWRGEWNLYAHPSQRSTLSTKVYYYDSDRELPGQVVYYNLKNAERLKDRNFFAQAHFRTYWNNGLSLMINGKFNWADTHYHDESQEYPNGVRDNYYLQREYYGSAAVLYVPRQEWAFSYAADYAYGTLNMNAISPSNASKPFRHTVLQSLTARYRTQRLTLTGMLLGSIYLNDVKEGTAASDARRLSPSFSASWKPLEDADLYLRASYKDIFRVATFTENYFDRWGSRDLKPEVARQLNVGVTYGHTSNNGKLSLQLSADGYYNYVKNKIVAMPYNMFFWTMVNLGHVDIIGADVTANATLDLGGGHSIIGSLAYTYQYAVDKTDPNSQYYKDQIPYTPRHWGSFSVAWENPWVNVSFHSTGVSKRYSSEQNSKANEMEGYIECGVAAYHTFQLKKGHEISLRGDIVNLLDKQYSVVKFYPMPGRTCKLTVSLTL